ncbi:MAG TPA: YidC/Oxa1 family membrane protein insertase [Solirubrobacteraceae bacterium]|nr:YidC/Oxa1 family membrane protein insertase [Solirubrobacteraceae bacterium]
MFIAANIFQPLIDVFEAVIKFFHDSIGVPWGWSIVLLTVAVRALLIPLTVKQMGSMQRMQQLQPQLKELQAKYKDDKERQQQEMMKFYRENKVNPLGSCLPLVAQIPVFISLFYMLRTSLRIDICRAHQPLLANGLINKAHLRPCGAGHGAGFLFINDLTNKATGAVLVTLIVLYVGTQLGSSLMMSSATMDRNQRMIMLVMPLFFVLFVINFPAGVLVYWITTNTWTMGQQYIIKRRIGPAKPAMATAGAPAGAAVVSPPSRSRGRAPGPADENGAAKANGGGNGTAAPAGGLSGLSGLIRGRGRPAEPAEPVDSRPAPPPPKSPRKKKKRSGRRR